MKRRIRIVSPTTMLAALFVAAGVAVAVYEENQAHLQRSRELRVQAEILAASVSAALAFQDQAAAQQYVSALRVNPEVRAAGVYSENGLLFADYLRSGAPLPARIDLSRRQGIAAPVLEKDVFTGFAYVAPTTEPLARRMSRFAGALLLMLTGVLVLGVQAKAHRVLARANEELEERAKELDQLNRRLKKEMEDHRRTEEALRQSQKLEAIGQLSGGIAHDFNNLLNVAKGNLQLLQRRLNQGRSDVQTYVASAMDGLNRAAALTQRILAFSRRQQLALRPVKLNALIAGMTDLLAHSTGERIRIEPKYGARSAALCDANQMENVILNLVINARDAMPSGGLIRIETCDVMLDKAEADELDVAAGPYVELIVRDDGEGMSSAVRERALDPFFTTKPQGKGTGLGLSVSYGYIRQLNGQLLIDSAPGKGTTVRILLPAAPAMEPVNS